MNPKQTLTDVGVIVARFQVHNLTDAHLDLIRTVSEQHKKVIVFLGLSPMIGTRNNPLDFEARKQMVLESFPDVTVLYIKDVGSDTVWSNRLDEHVKDHLLPSQNATLYGGRDSFIKHYTGKFPTQELESSHVYSGTELRKEISSRVKSSPDFRAGAIWSVYNRYPSAIPTVDVVIYDIPLDVQNFPTKIRLLLVRKQYESKYRFVGGYAQPNTDSYEIDAKREVREEVGVSIQEPRYIGSAVISDWRYEQEVDKIKTILYDAEYIHGPVNIEDVGEIAEARWFEFASENDDGPQDILNVLVDEHKPLFKMWFDKFDPFENE